MAVTITIAGVSYPFIENNGQPVPGYVSGSGSANTTSSNVGIAGGSDSGYQQTSNLQERQRWQCDVMDYSGTAAVQFQKGDQVVVADPVLGVLFRGFINTDKMQTIYPSGIVRHSIDCTGLEDIPGRRTYTRTYNTSSEAGKIAVDMLNSVLLNEGIAQNFAEHEDDTAGEFNQGILSGTVGLVDSNGNNWLELAQAGSNVSITENTTALFSTGTLTNVQANNNQLLPTTVSGLKVQVDLPIDSNQAFLELHIWAGSLTLGSNDTLNYSEYVDSSSPEIKFASGFNFSDGTSTGNLGLLDQHGYSDQSGTDLSNFAKGQWYTRNISLAAVSGKTITSVYIVVHGLKAGTYIGYLQNFYLSSGTVFFATNATTTQLNPIQVASITGYAPASLITSIVPVISSALSSRISPNYTINTVNLVSNSSISWVGTSVDIYASYDGGTTYAQCTNNAILPALPAGSNVSGNTLTLKEVFLVGTSPETLPTLSNVQVNLYSAPNATKSDITGQFVTQAQWNTGTYTSLTSPSGGGLTMGTITSPWLNNTLTPDFFLAQELALGDVTQSIASHTEKFTVPVYQSAIAAAIDRLDWIGTLTGTNGISFEFDVSLTHTNNFSSALFVNYLQTFWYSGTVIYHIGGPGSTGGFWYSGYTVAYQQSGIANNLWIEKGANGSSSSSSTVLGSATISTDPTHIKVVVSAGGAHNVYLNGSSTSSLTVTDTTYTSGQIAVGAMTFNQTTGYGQTSTFTFANATITPNSTTEGTWLGPANSISSLGTIENSVIYWNALNTGNNIAAAYVQTSIDGGSTFQTCSNGGQIPGLTPGTNVAGKSVQAYVWMVNASGNLPLPIVASLSWRVLGAYPGSSGTRSTVPLGNDTMVRSNVTGSWGTAFDSQTYTKTGTGTTNLTSNEGTIANTTGDVHMVLGSRTWTDEDGTVRFQLSAATIVAGIELRYTDANNFYRLQASTTAVSIIKVQSGVSVTLASVSMTLATGVWYRMRFRVTGATQPLLSGNVWLSGSLEPTINATTGQWNNSLWTIQVYD